MVPVGREKPQDPSFIGGELLQDAGVRGVGSVLGTDVGGLTEQFSATGTYSDASTAPLAGVAWSSDTPSVATVDNAGLATGGGTGTATITATSGPFSGSATIAVVDALTITTTSPLAAGVQGSQYSQTLAAAGGVGPYTWSKASAQNWWITRRSFKKSGPRLTGPHDRLLASGNSGLREARA